MLKLKLQYFGPWCEELTRLKRPWCWERLKAGGEGDDREWDGWMASLTQWTWVWVNSWSWWWTGRPGVLQFMGSQRVGHDWATEVNWTGCVRGPVIASQTHLVSRQLPAATGGVPSHRGNDSLPLPAAPSSRPFGGSLQTLPSCCEARSVPTLSVHGAGEAPASQGPILTPGRLGGINACPSPYLPQEAVIRPFEGCLERWCPWFPWYQQGCSSGMHPISAAAQRPTPACGSLIDWQLEGFAFCGTRAKTLEDSFPLFWQSTVWDGQIVLRQCSAVNCSLEWL